MLLIDKVTWVYCTKLQYVQHIDKNKTPIADKESVNKADHTGTDTDADKIGTDTGSDKTKQVILKKNLTDLINQKEKLILIEQA